VLPDACVLPYKQSAIVINQEKSALISDTIPCLSVKCWFNDNVLCAIEEA
jgi:hypothetical protein